MNDSSSNTTEEDAEQPTLVDDVSLLLKEIRSASRRLSRAKNLLKDLSGKQPDVADFEAWVEAYRGLEDYELPVDELDEKRRAVVERMGEAIRRLQVKARMQFVTKFEMLADERDLDVEKISESPLVLHVEPLTVEIDFDAGGARLLYGHEEIEDLPIDAGELMSAHGDAVATIEDEQLESEDFFGLLRDAYRTVIVADHAEDGERVELVDVLVPLALLRADRGDWRKKGPNALEAFPRHLLAWQLAKLRRDGLLEHDGVRLDLGAATGGSTRDKSDVLFIPVGAQNGQYYRSIRFEQV